jgi:hypothetical protein
MKFLNFFFRGGAILACLDPCPDSKSGYGSSDPIESGSETLVSLPALSCTCPNIGSNAFRLLKENGDCYVDFLPCKKIYRRISKKSNFSSKNSLPALNVLFEILTVLTPVLERKQL